MGFAGTPGNANCYGQSISAFTGQYHGLNAAIAALGYSSAKALQNTSWRFAKLDPCWGDGAAAENDARMIIPWLKL
jgi:hypothetical protein